MPFTWIYDKQKIYVFDLCAPVAAFMNKSVFGEISNDSILKFIGNQDEHTTSMNLIMLV